MARGNERRACRLLVYVLQAGPMFPEQAPKHLVLRSDMPLSATLPSGAALTQLFLKPLTDPGTRQGPFHVLVVQVVGLGAGH